MRLQLPNRKAKILLVDDIEANLIALHAVLDSADYELIDATCGEEAVELCRQQEFALIVLDIQMPGIDGFETASLIKNETINRDVPIMFVTAIYREDPFIKRGFEVGAIDYFGKPFDPEILKAKVSIYTDLYLKTKRLTDTEELLKSHSQIKTLLEAIPVGVVIADADGKLYETNEEASRIWPGLKTLNASEIVPLKKALSLSETIRDEIIEIETESGQKKSLLSSAYPILSRKGAVLGAVMVLQDISMRQLLGAEVERQVLEFLRQPQSSEATNGASM